MDALKDFPDFETKLYTEKGDAVCQKLDIFKGYMWFAYTDNFSQWHLLEIEQVKEIMAINKESKRASALEDYAVEPVAAPEKDFNNAMGQESLTRFDQPKRKKRPTKKKNPAVSNQNETPRPAGGKPQIIAKKATNVVKPNSTEPVKTDEGEKTAAPRRNNQNRKKKPSNRNTQNGPMISKNNNPKPSNDSQN